MYNNLTSRLILLSHHRSVERICANPKREKFILRELGVPFKMYFTPTTFTGLSSGKEWESKSFRNKREPLEKRIPSKKSTPFLHLNIFCPPWSGVLIRITCSSMTDSNHLSKFYSGPASILRDHRVLTTVSTFLQTTQKRDHRGFSPQTVAKNDKRRKDHWTRIFSLP